MLDTLFSNTASETLSFGTTILIILSALALGLCISLVYQYTHQREDNTGNINIALIILPAIIAMIILLVGNNVARAFSLAGAFSLIRYRSAPGDSRDIAFVFFTLGVGLACGMGYIGYAVLFAAILCLVMVILDKVNFGNSDKAMMRLKILFPENMDYHGTFDAVLQEYTWNNRLIRVKTVDFGSLFEITYDITMKNLADSKTFIDKLRCKNGNLTVTLNIREQTEVGL